MAGHLWARERRPGPSTALVALALVITLLPGASGETLQPDFQGVVGMPLAMNVTVDPGGPVDMYRWDFEGDGAFDLAASAPNVTHTYDAEGTYQAVLAANLTNGTVRMWLYLVEIAPRDRPPVVVITGHPGGYVGTDRLTAVELDGTAVDDGTIVGYDWDFDGDGEYDWSSTTGARVSHTYTELGTFGAVLRATDDVGASGTATLTVEVVNLAPVIWYQSAISTNDPHVTLQTTAEDPDGEISVFVWDFNDGSPSVNTTSPRVDHTFPDASGGYMVEMVAWDDDGGSSSFIFVVAVLIEEPYVAPRVDAGKDMTTVVGRPVQFNANVTRGTGIIIHHHWDLDGDAEWDADGKAQTYVYEEAGTYEVTVSVEDEFGFLANDSLVVTVLPEENAPPVPVPSVEQWVRPGHELLFSQLSYDVDGAIVLYQWDFDGDGRFDYADTEVGNVTHVYEDEGVYVAVLQVTDNRGEVASASVNIRVDHDAPTDDGVDDSMGAAVCCISMVVAMVAIAYWTMRRTVASPRKDGGPADAPGEPPGATGPTPPEGGPD